MKTKRWISILLTLALYLGLLPGAALATEEGTESSLPEGYEQMYYQFATGQYGADIEVNINSRTALVDNLFADSNGSTKLDVTTFEFSFSIENLGAIVDNNYCWDTNSSAVAGTLGYLYAISESQKYAIPVAIREDNRNSGDSGDSNTGDGEDDPVIELPALPDGCERMYVSYDDGETFEAEISKRAGDGGAQAMYIGDGDTKTVLTNAYTFICTDGLGEVFWDENREKLGWNAGDGIPGTSGYLYAEITVEGVTTKYAIAASVNAPNVGVYSDETLSKYLTVSNRTFVCDVENEANPVVYVAAGDEGVTITDIDDDSEGKLSYVLPTGGAKSVAITLSDSVNGEISTEIFVTLSNGRKPSVRLKFVDGTTTLYNGDDTSISCSAGGDCVLNLVLKTYGEEDVSVTDLESISCTIGSVVQLDDGRLVWQCFDLIPGDSGYIQVTTSEDAYTIPVTVDPPVFGLYSEIPTNDDYSGYIPRTNGKATVNFTSGEAKTVYLYIGNEHFSFIKDSIASDNTAVAVTYVDSRTLAVTLAEGSTGGINAEITCPGTDGNNNEQDWDYRIIFNDGTALYDERGNVLTLRNEAGGVQTRHIYYGEKRAEVPVSAEVKLSDPTLGTMKAATGNALQYGNWEWDREFAVPGASGKLYVTVDGKTYSCDVVVEMPLVGVYSDREFKNLVINSTFEYTTGNEPTVYIHTTDGSTISSIAKEGDNEYITATLSDDKTYAAVTISENPFETTGTAFKVITSDDEMRYVTVTFVNTSQDGSIGGINFKETLISETRPIEDADKITRRESRLIEAGPAEFQYDANGDGKPETYYLCTMGPMYEDGNNVGFSMGYAGGVSQPYAEDAFFQTGYCIGIWTYNAAADYYTLVDGDTKDTLLAAFGDSWSVSAYHSPDDETNTYPAESFPDVYSWTPADGWPCGRTFIHYADCIGSWDYAYTGTIDGKTVTAYAHCGFVFSYEALEATVSTVAEANQILQHWADIKDPNDSGFLGDTTYALYLLPGEYKGVIQVPREIVVDIIGSTTDERTVLTGGVLGDGLADVRNIDFIGCGWWATNWPENEYFNGELNYGLGTAKGGRYSDCSFKNYYHALHCGYVERDAPNMIFGGERTVFENNFIALYLNSNRNGGGNLTMYANTFRYNGCALWLESMGNDFPLNHYHVIQCKFYDNGWDTINLLGKCYFLPGQLFERDGQYGHGKFAGRRDALNDPPKENAPQRASHATANVSEEGSGVYTFPVAKNDKFNDFDYTNKDAVIGNHNASDWLIPEKDLDGKTITVIQDEKGEDKVVWSFGE